MLYSTDAFESSYLLSAKQTHNHPEIIIVEDDPAISQVIAEALAEEGYTVAITFDGRSGLKLAQQVTPRLVISDLMLPRMDGLELLGEVKQRRPELPVVMVTAYRDDERQRRARELGAFEFFTKPVNLDHLKEQLRQMQPANSKLDGGTNG